MIAWPDGRRDTGTEVYWLQGPRQYADLRIPPGRSAHRGIACLRDLDRTMLDFMARQEGFFGELDVVRSIGTWHRAFDCQPDAGVPDRGALSFDRGMLIERGVARPYVERWRRESGSDAVMSVRLSGAASPCTGCIVAAGDAFIYARGRAAALPGGASLAQLIAQSPTLEAAQDLFDCEVSFGHRGGAAWRIARSSLCFREGASLAPVLDERASMLRVDDVSPCGAAVRRQWQIDDFACTGATPLRRWLDPEFHPNSIAQVSAR
ncbi:MAG TPA: hypothetical protein VLX44_18460 [Xanthobacteraceae bacterium]|nr:hypothetical protein [Xanthobacteraceae bacterium]